MDEDKKVMNLDINATIEAEQDAVERCGEHFSESESPRLRDHAGPLEEVRGSARPRVPGSSGF